MSVSPVKPIGQSDYAEPKPCAKHACGSRFGAPVRGGRLELGCNVGPGAAVLR